MFIYDLFVLEHLRSLVDLFCSILHVFFFAVLLTTDVQVSLYIKNEELGIDRLTTKFLNLPYRKNSLKLPYFSLKVKFITYQYVRYLTCHIYM